MDDVEAERPTPPLPAAPAEEGASRSAAAQEPHRHATFVYAVGKVEPRFPDLATEKEFAQAAGRADTSGQTDYQALHTVLAERANRYLARRMCWVFTIEGLDTYILLPSDPADFELLIEAVRPRPRPGDVDVVIGTPGPIAPPEVCNGMMIPLVAFDQLYSFDRDELIREIPRPDDTAEEEFRATAAELFGRIMQIADNAGATDEHRAFNYLAVRYPAIYARTAEAHRDESALTVVDARRSRLTGARTVVDVIFSYTNRRTDVTDKYFVRVDVTGEFPFLVTRLSPYYERA
jgi:hypothetical protein